MVDINRINKMSKLIDFVVNEEHKIVNWFQRTEPTLIDALLKAAAIQRNFMLWAKSPSGLLLQDAIKRFIPQGESWTSEALTIAEDLGKDLAVCSSKAGIEGVCLRLLAEIAAVIHGKKLPTGIAGYIAEAQNLFVP